MVVACNTNTTSIAEPDPNKPTTPEAPEPNQAPEASFQVNANFLTIEFDASSSTDADGEIESYSWEYGDNATGSGKTTEHTYKKEGTYDITLTVTDDDGVTSSSTQELTVSPFNQPPTAQFTLEVNDLTVKLDASESFDSDGNIETYNWDYGDGIQDAGIKAEHVYAEAGSYIIKLTVTDFQGAINTLSEEVIVGANQPPGAEFSYERNFLTVTFDASASKDSDGTITEYNWNFGDGNTAQGQQVKHSYQQAGNYKVKLVVLDEQGASSSLIQDIIVSDVPNQKPVAHFEFENIILRVRFDASASRDEDGIITSYRWDFGDGTEGIDADPIHDYAQAGSYDVSLIVTDNKGATQKINQTIEVGAKGRMSGQVSFDPPISNVEGNLLILIDILDFTGKRLSSGSATVNDDYSFEAEVEVGKNLLAAWLDVNGDNKINDGDYIGSKPEPVIVGAEQLTENADFTILLFSSINLLEQEKLVERLEAKHQNQH